MVVDNYHSAKEYYENEEYEKAYTILLKLAQNGHVRAQAILASMLEEGKGIESNDKEALFWYEKAANNNHEQALYIWGIHNLKTLEKIDEGKKYIEKSVSLKYPDAIHFLATCLDLGEYGYVKNEIQAIELYKQACLLKHKISCAYLYNILVERNEKDKFYDFVNHEMGRINMLKLMIIPYFKNCLVNFFTKVKGK